MQTIDAQWASLAANKDHGLRRSQADKRRAIRRALKQREEEKPNTKIAEHVGCDDKTVAKYRRELESSSEFPKMKERLYLLTVWDRLLPKLQILLDLLEGRREICQLHKVLGFFHKVLGL